VPIVRIPESISQLVVTPGAKKKCCSPAPARDNSYLNR